MSEIKLHLLKEYCKLQAYDKYLWFVAQTAKENYLHHEIRLMVWLIQHATNDEIIELLAKKSELNHNNNK